MKRYGILLAVFMAFVLAITLTSGCSTPKKATKEDVTKSGNDLLPDEELAKQRAEQEARERALRAGHSGPGGPRQGGGSRGVEPEGPRGFISISTVRSSATKPVRSWAKAAAQLKASPKKALTIEGNCDDRGTNEYNLALGQQRADAAARYLQNLGIDRKRVKTISYGEERPVCWRPREACWHKNRNATFVYR